MEFSSFGRSIGYEIQLYAFFKAAYLSAKFSSPNSIDILKYYWKADQRSGDFCCRFSSNYMTISSLSINDVRQKESKEDEYDVFDREMRRSSISESAQ